MASKFNASTLEKLSPEIRGRVESALQAALERELATVADGGGSTPEAQHSRSKGAIFSRSRTSDLFARDDIESLVARNIQTMDDGAFDKFAKRLGTLRNIKTTG